MEREFAEMSPCTRDFSISLDSDSINISKPQHFIQEDMIKDCVNTSMEVAFSDVVVPAFEVRNTFIEVCQDSSKLEALRPVRSDPDLLALEREAIN